MMYLGLEVPLVPLMHKSDRRVLRLESAKDQVLDAVRDPEHHASWDTPGDVAIVIFHRHLVERDSDVILLFHHLNEHDL